MRARAGALAAALVLAAASPASAQSLPQPQPGVPVPGRSMAGITDASATALNPANLGFLPAWEARALWFRTGDDSPLPNRGWSVDVATPLVFDIAGGIRLDFVRPPGSAPIADHQRWLTGALAYELGPGASIGASLSRSYSDRASLDGLWASTASLSLRPSAYLGASLAARNWNGDRNAEGGGVERSYDAGLLLRPLGRRAVEIGLEAGYVPRTRDWFPRATLGLDVPGVGRLVGDVRVDRPFEDGRAYVATAGLELNAGALQASGGGVFGSEIGKGGAGFYAGLALRGYREPGFASPGHVVKLRVESTPGARAHVRTLRALWRIADDPSVLGLALVLKTEPTGSFAHAEELADAVRMLRARGKKVFCMLEDAAGRSLHVCSQADRVLINPAGGVRVSGLRTQYMYFGELLSKVGVRADFVRIGPHKSAAEQFTERGPSKVAAEDHEDTLAQLEKVWVSDIGGGRRLSVDELRARIARGPFVAKEAREAGLVDGYAFDDELDAVAAELVGRRVPVVEASQSPVFAQRAPQVMGERERVAVIYVEGDMIDGRSRDIPLIGTKLVGSYTVAAALKQAREDARVKAIVLRVETPGGSSMAAEVIWREVQLAAKAKPVVVSMGAIAASAGYYISSPGTVLYANRTTITGSIGIFYGKADVDGLLKKIGVNIVTHRTAPRADAESFYRPFTEDERQELGRKVKQFYDVFVDRVSRGRKLPPDEVDAAARGRVWTGSQALDKKLIDRLGGLREALAEAEKLGGMAPGAPIVELPERPRDLLSTVLSLAGIGYAYGSSLSPEREAGSSLDAPAPPPEGSSSEPSSLPPELLRIGRALAPFLIYAPDQPQARLELAPELP